jgi:hypothetical protein
MKFALLLSTSKNEIEYVKAESKKPHGPYLEFPYEDVDEENEWDNLQ